MAKFQLLVLIDSILLSTTSKDTLVLCRKVNDVFSTALAVASVNPANARIPPLLSQNMFSWADEYKVRLSYQHENGALIVSQSNSIDIKHGQTSHFFNKVLQPAVTTVVDTSEVVEKDLDIFNIAEAPYNSTVEVLQKAGASSSFFPIYRFHPAGFSQDFPISVSNEFSLFWTGFNVSYGDDIKPSGNRYEFVISEGAKPTTIRFGFAQSDSPGPREDPTWQTDINEASTELLSIGDLRPKL
ncbi:hypothetical protein BKA66DRAFT_437184 [Pyrenochaeta sp. MPI-SDFR-AT-0127]|nr:hypothetical protein BKA66DRAFT_437184 [Pyrenochaeta sp. MPI-SDFR-AT-0127]